MSEPEVAPAISVVIPMYDCVAHLREAVESVLQQTLPPSQVVLVDDGSTDGGLDVALDFAKAFPSTITVLQQAHQGIGVARNLGCAHATGEFLAFQDADDIWLPYKLRDQVQLLLDRPDLDFVNGQISQFFSPEEQVSDAEREQLAGKVFSVPVAASCIFRRSSFERVGPFREDIHVGEFIDWLARAKDAGLQHESIASIVLQRRLHGTNTGVRDRHHRGEYATVLRDILTRRRAVAATAEAGPELGKTPSQKP